MSAPRTILHVDDEPAVFAGVRRTMRRARPEWTFEYAESITAARARVERGGIDLIITDYSMPGGNGLDLVAAIRADDDAVRIPVILLSGAGDLDLKRRALDSGAADLLTKPVNTEDLVARIENLLRDRDSTARLEDRERELTGIVHKQQTDIEAAHLEVIFRLAILAEYRDEMTGNHVLRVGSFSQLIARSLGLDDAMQGELLLAAPLHDIGKVAMPDQILLKRGALLESEWEVVRSHCRIGHEILTGQGTMESTIRSTFSMLLGLGGHGVKNPVLESAAEIALTHHERWDGGGYPYGIRGDAIPLRGRIVAVADVFDALTSERTYKPAMPMDDAIRMLRMERGRHFDPEVVDAFLDVLPAVAETRYRLSDRVLRREAA